MAIPGIPAAPNGEGLKAVHAIFSAYTWQEMGIRLFWALVILAGTFILVKIFQVSFEHARKRFRNGAQFIYIVEKLGSYTLILAGILAAISSLGVSLGSLTIFAGAIGVGLGLGLQGIVKEFVAGIVLIFDSSIEVGDFIELEDGIRGEVMEIGPRATRIRSNDDLHIIIPNFTVMQSRVRNWTYNDGSRRLHIPFSVAEESDPAKVRDIVLEAARKLPMTMPDDQLHKTQVWLTSFAGSGLDFDLVVWPTRESSRHPRTVHAAYTWAIYEALRAAGIQNANDQVDINMTSLFGRTGEEAVGAIRERDKPRRAKLPAQTEAAPNDAVEAMRMDATRQAGLREDGVRDGGREGGRRRG
ncbi:mechanosensitive ion channel family protein [Sandaracinobacteroides hominis]|uniref:mechanosensitive ion channel family protein n=1 Tax=Sandaracinobacteroides hominis TaxID=2780086 RepID=UPI0018F37027|nr:mechanosensitive ion channel domain-containing protein [Sandaracinobacteroides hominis]